ncbi:hypothetical protein YH65_02370 [Sulfurovum lithotrophicum]|uniref:Uncharacterized protein n=1 Tax=Sulfurovum lithotrophicum TaxID=206403 RepID=A0A7U4RQ69_9BACT|nr:hypothetical protein [Sulfurovum lithotrophicum]AKF24366.1 hypothetical protein YH65_02370 [Sulfurovum lithotrophicum]
MKRNFLLKCLLIGAVASVGAFAEMTVEKTNGSLTITSDISGTVIAKVMGPNGEVIVNKTYEGNSFSWTPSGPDGAYRYNVRVVPKVEKAIASANKATGAKSDYAGGSVEVRNAQMTTDTKEKE